MFWKKRQHGVFNGCDPNVWPHPQKIGPMAWSILIPRIDLWVCMGVPFARHCALWQHSPQPTLCKFVKSPSWIQFFGLWLGIFRGWLGALKLPSEWLADQICWSSTCAVVWFANHVQLSGREWCLGITVSESCSVLLILGMLGRVCLPWWTWAF